MSSRQSQHSEAASRSRGSLDAQREQWERALTERRDRFGIEPSGPARVAADLFQREGATHLLELGAGQGRDTLFFAGRGFDVTALDYADAGVTAIDEKAAAAGLSERVHTSRFDARQPLPFADESFHACFSHMLYCMAFTEHELAALSAQVSRVLRPRGLNVYTARTTRDPDFSKGEHRGEQLYELDGFIVHFFDRDLVTRVADRLEIIEIDEFEEGSFPRRLYRVTLRKGNSREND